MKTWLDQMNRKVNLKAVPQRIVSVVPSQTELLYDLGCGSSVVGQTVFCVHPRDKFKVAHKIGGTKKLKIKEIIALKPDLIIGNKEENTQSEIEELSQHFPVWMSDIYTLEDAISMIESVGEILQKEREVTAIVQNIKEGFAKLTLSHNPISCLYFIWRKPWMAAGSQTFINDMMQKCGLQNVCSPTSRYPELTNAEIADLNPQTVLLSSEPYPFKEKHIAELQTLLPNSKIVLVDGELFSWYGSRLMHAPSYFSRLLNILS
jgi:ABC-type Fe3+-hydroxamate transport system substrate-binding protein